MEDKKRKSAKEQVPKQFFDGKTYACQSCKNGHRVRTCNHGRTKPIAPTNQPGRPSSGSKRKCTCTKNCGCKDNCKCEKNCLCIQKMYLICLVSKPGEIPRTSSPKPPIWENEDGQAETLKTVWADASGQLLTDTEAERRQREREQMEQGKSCCSSKADVPKPAPQGGCRHRTTIKEETPALETVAPNKCTCGTACQCTLCPEHPNNAATRQYNASTLHLMASQHAYLPAPSMMTGPMYTPAVPQESCMGGQPRFYLTRNKPTQQDFHNFFPGAMNGDYVMSYPVDQSPWSVQSPMMQIPDPLQSFQPVQAQPPVMPLTSDVPFDDQILDMDWTAQDDMWEMRLGDASVDQIEQYPPFDPSALQVPSLNGYVSPGSVPYNAFDTSFQQTPLTSVSSPNSFSVSMSAISSPPALPIYHSFDIPPDINFSQHSSPAISRAQTRTGSCCGGSREYTPNDMDMFDMSLPNMPLSPIPSPRVVQTGPGSM